MTSPVVRKRCLIERAFVPDRPCLACSSLRSVIPFSRSAFTAAHMPSESGRGMAVYARCAQLLSHVRKSVRQMRAFREALKPSHPPPYAPRQLTDGILYDNPERRESARGIGFERVHAIGFSGRSPAPPVPSSERLHKESRSLVRNIQLSSLRHHSSASFSTFQIQLRKLSV